MSAIRLLRRRHLGLIALLLAVLQTLLLSLPAANANPAADPAPLLEVFVRDGCPHCAAAKAFLPKLERAHEAIRAGSCQSSRAFER